MMYYIVYIYIYYGYSEPVLEVIGHKDIPPGVALLAREILNVIGIDNVVLIVIVVCRIAANTPAPVGSIPGRHTVIGQIALRLAVRDVRRGVEAALIDVLHFHATMAIELSLQRAAATTLPIIGCIVGIHALHNVSRLCAILEVRHLARLIRRTCTYILLRAVYNLGTVVIGGRG